MTVPAIRKDRRRRGAAGQRPNRGPALLPSSCRKVSPGPGQPSPVSPGESGLLSSRRCSPVSSSGRGPASTHCRKCSSTLPLICGPHPCSGHRRVAIQPTQPSCRSVLPRCHLPGSVGATLVSVFVVDLPALTAAEPRKVDGGGGRCVLSLRPPPLRSSRVRLGPPQRRRSRHPREVPEPAGV